MTLLDQTAPADPNGAWTTAFQVQMQKHSTASDGNTLWQATVSPTGKVRGPRLAGKTWL